MTTFTRIQFVKSHIEELEHAAGKLVYQAQHFYLVAEEKAKAFVEAGLAKFEAEDTPTVSSTGSAGVAEGSAAPEHATPAPEPAEG